MIKGLTELEKVLDEPITLIVGGGGAMVLAYDFPLATNDIDGFSKGIEPLELDRRVKMVAEKIGLPKDWLNSYFSTFAHTLPKDYESRLVEVLQKPKLTVKALGKEDLLIMKCFAGRQKDVPHAKVLIKKGADLSHVEAHLNELKQKRIPKSDQALDFLYDVQEMLEGD